SRSEDAVVLTAALERETGRRVDGVVGAFLRSGRQGGDGARREDGRDAQGVDEGRGCRATAQLAVARVAARGPGAEATLRDQIAAAGQQSHLEELTPVQPRPDDLLTVAPRGELGLR